jgi:hypothetical protein
LHLGGFALNRRLASLLGLASLLVPTLSRFRAHSGAIRLSLCSWFACSLAHLALARLTVLAALHARRRLLALLRLLRKSDRNRKSGREGRRADGSNPRPSHDASP